VWRLTGHAAVPSPLIVVAIGYTPVGESAGDHDETEALAAAEEGAALVKLMGGFDEPAHDVARATRLVQQLPANVGVAIDVNAAWSPPVAAAMLPLLADAGVRMVEDGYPYELGVALPASSRGSNTPDLAMGEVLSSPLEVRALLRDHSVSWLRLDATLVGGPVAFTNLCALARQHGVGLMPHYWPEFHRHLLPPPARGNRPDYLECTLPGAGGFGQESFVRGLPRLQAGGLTGNEGGGFGLDLDWAAIEKLAHGDIGRLDARRI
jgi:L-alanine-DL-glutamate epimerase-like enolase superfamily enzyme